MDIETVGLGAGSYPEPKEEMTKTVDITINVEYKCAIEVPENWNYEKIEDDIKDNIVDYINDSMLSKWEVDINE